MKIRLYANNKGDRQTFINLSKEGLSKDGSQLYWFSLINETGGSESNPYGFTTRERLEELRNSINNLLKQ